MPCQKGRHQGSPIIQLLSRILECSVGERYPRNQGNHRRCYPGRKQAIMKWCVLLCSFETVCILNCEVMTYQKLLVIPIKTCLSSQSSDTWELCISKVFSPKYLLWKEFHWLLCYVLKCYPRQGRAGQRCRKDFCLRSFANWQGKLSSSPSLSLLAAQEILVLFRILVLYLCKCILFLQCCDLRISMKVNLVCIFLHNLIVSLDVWLFLSCII